MKKFLLLAFCCCTLSFVCGQISESEFSGLAKEYANKYKDLLQTRGSNPSYLNKGYESQNDPESMVEILREYYEEMNIAVLVYFYEKGELSTFLVDKYEVSKMGHLKIEKDSLISLSKRITQSLSLGKKILNRSPQLRGAGNDEAEDTKIETFEDVSKNATRILLPNANRILRYSHLIIVPCLNLGSFPFYLLRPAENHYLVDILSYSIAPSFVEIEIAIKKNIATNPSSIRNKKRSYHFDNPLLVANPDYPKKGKYIFPDLPGAKKEIDSSLHLFSTYTFYTGANATKANVLKDFSSHDLVYFATHGISNSSNPLDSSYLVLASENDPFLTTREIARYMDSSVKMDMVILSACQTGLGKIHDAGVIGLSRAFLLAGASNVIMSLWNVNDDATAFLMQHFLFNITKPEIYFPAEPLRKAILATKEKYPDPSMWASFAVFGIPY